MMFSRPMTATLTSRPLLTSAVIIGVGAAAAATTIYGTRSPHQKRQGQIRLDSAMATPQQSMAAKKTFTGPFGLSFPQLTVTKVEDVSHDTKKITFELPGKDEISGLRPGNAVITRHFPDGKWIPVFRPYTPVHDLDEPGVLTLLVKKYPNGKASTHLHSLQPGSTLAMRGPLPGYSYAPSTSPRQVMMIAGGAGITPIYSLAKGILNDPADKTVVEVVWGVNGTRDIVLKQEFEELESRHPDRLHVTYAVSGPEASPGSPELGNDHTKWKKGYVNKQVLEEVAARIQKNGKGPWGDEKKGTKVFLCGPPKMEESVAGKSGWFGGGEKGILEEMGVETGKVHRF